jgi:carboxynorspermidine decarboxylase
MQIDGTESKITTDILGKIPSPCWVLEENLLKKNLEILNNIKKETEVSILLALKGFALWHVFDILGNTLDGCCASGLYEARLAAEEFRKEVHTYSPAFRDEEIDEIASISQHLVFNSPSQVHFFSKRAKTVNPAISLGLRVNPEYSEAPVELYNPCGAYSRLGTLAGEIDEKLLRDIEGFHFHALCEQDASAFQNVLDVFEKKFGRWLPKLKWVNFGGGHHITRLGYNRNRLMETIIGFRSRYPHLKLYLEPGEAVAWETGPLVATVLDIVENGMKIAILDTSAEAHMPDTVIMPYRAEVRGAGKPGEKAFTYRLGGNTCLAGDIMGDYSFDRPLQKGDRIIFEDQMHYTMVKATTFNGIQLPGIAVLRDDGSIDILRQFDYHDFKSRLG